MLATQILKEEHKIIKLALKILEQICNDIEKGSDFDIAHLERLVEFIKVFADKCRHGKEEDLLFKAMEDAGVPHEGGPIAVMLMEHDMGRGYVKGLSEGAIKYKNGSKDAIKTILTNARNYIELLREHIYKEDNILYQIADLHLSESIQNDLVKEFESVDEVRIGKSKHEELISMIKELKDIYKIDE